MEEQGQAALLSARIDVIDRDELFAHEDMPRQSHISGDREPEGFLGAVPCCASVEAFHVNQALIAS